MNRIFAAVSAAALLLTALVSCGTSKPAQAAVPGDFKLFDSTEIREVALALTEENWNDLLDNALDKPRVEAERVTIDGVAVNKVAVKTKGGTSLSDAVRHGKGRYGLSVDLGRYVEGQTLDGVRKFALNNMFGDESLMREYLSYTLLEEMGVPTPQFGYVCLTVNGAYRGLYFMLENLEPELVSRALGETDGLLAKPDAGSDLVWRGADGDYSGVLGNLNMGEGEEARKLFLTWLEGLDALCAEPEPNGAEYLARLEELVDVDALLRYFAANTYLANTDSYQCSRATNYGLYISGAGRAALFPWDYNRSFGLFVDGAPNFDITEPTGTQTRLEERPLLNALLRNDVLRQRYYGYIADCVGIAEGFQQTMREWCKPLGAAWRDDPTAFCTEEEFVTGLDELYWWNGRRLIEVRAQLDALAK